MSGVDPFIIYVIVAKDINGDPRGIEKSTDKIYFNKIDAERDLCASNYIIKECVVMDYEHYNAIMSHYVP